MAMSGIGLPEVVTFDCAQTLVAVNWTVDGFVVDCAEHIGLDLPSSAGDLYRNLYYERLHLFLEANLTGDPKEREAFWHQLGIDWLNALGKPESWIKELEDVALELGFGPKSILFKIYDDVPECLEALKQMGIRMAVVSNWDYSLHRVIDMFGISPLFEGVFASLEFGVEKPDPRFFHHALDALGVEPSKALHVGDNPIDDLQGARAVGMRAILLTRDHPSPPKGILNTLRDLPEALTWNA